MFWLMALGSLVGAAAGIAGTWQQGDREKKALEKQKESAWQQYQYGKEHSDKQFGIQKTEAMEQLGMQRKNLDTQMGLSVDDYNTALLAQAFGIQDAKIQTSSAVGESLAAEGASGTKGSASGDMTRNYASQSLDRNIGLQDTQNRNQLNSMISGANMTANAIAREEASWMPGGHRVKSKEAQDAYNLDIANLGQSNFDWQIKQSEPGFLDYFTGAMGGASTGMSTAQSFDQFVNAWGSTGKAKKYTI